MPQDKNKNRLSKLQESQGIFSGLSRTARLVLRLMGDSRVNFFLKLLPIGSLVYLISPLDAAIPVIDDAFIIGLGTYVFIELCPPDVLEEHRAQLVREAGARENDEVVEADFTEK